MNWQSRPQLLTTLSAVGVGQPSWREPISSFGYHQVTCGQGLTIANTPSPAGPLIPSDKLCGSSSPASGVNMAFEEGPLSSDLWSEQLAGRDLIFALTQRDPPDPKVLSSAHKQDSASGGNIDSATGASTTTEDAPQFTHGFDEKIFDITKIAASDFASQITLMFLPVFQAIQPDELTTMGWIRKDKGLLSPNVVEFTKLFNNINFWVQEEILKERSLPRRAEVLSHFVKIAKELMKLSNIHGTMAVLAALQSEPIYRLKRTWALLGHRQQTYDKLCIIFNQEDNRMNLRKYMEQAKLPVIPYLGMYTSDLVYIDTKYPSTGGLESQARQDQINNILRTLSEFQHSEYNIPLKPHLREYLQQKRYIEELQTFRDKENHDTSLRLEPDHHHPHMTMMSGGDSSGVEAVGGSGATTAASVSSGVVSEKFARSRDDMVHALSSAVDCKSGVAGGVTLRHKPVERAFIPGHRKSKSLGTDPFDPLNFNEGMGASAVGPGSPQSLCGVAPAAAQAAPTSARRNLVDDTPIQSSNTAERVPSARKPPFEGVTRHTSPGKGRSPDHIATLPRQRPNYSGSRTSSASRSVGRSATLGGSSRGSEESCGSTAATAAVEAASRGSVQLTSAAAAQFSQHVLSEPFICEGCLRRKTVMRSGRHIRAAMYTRFWVGLAWHDPYPVLLYFAAKSWSGNSRTDFKRSPTKVQNIADCLVLPNDSPPTLQLVSVAGGNTYKFRLPDAPEQPNLERWLTELHRLIKRAKEPKDLISFESVPGPSPRTETTPL